MSNPSAHVYQTSGDALTACRFEAYVVARVGATKPVLTALMVFGITCTVYDETDTQSLDPTYGPVSLTPADVLFSVTPWAKDRRGHNFAYEVPGSAFPDGNAKYRVQFAFTPTSGTPFYVKFQHATTFIY